MSDWTAIAKKQANFGHGEPNEKLYRDKNWLYQKYIIEKLSIIKIAKLTNKGSSGIIYWLKVYNIKRRTISETLKGRIFSKEHRINLGNSLKKRYQFYHHPKKDRPVSEITRKKIGDANRGEKSGRWKGGKVIRKKGYIYIFKPNHPRAEKRGYVPEQILIAEKALGRNLNKNEKVHHINFDKHDNRNSNLLICSHSYHRCLHNKIEFLRIKKLEEQNNELLIENINLKIQLNNFKERHGV